MTLDEVLVAGWELLEQNHIPSARLTAEILLAHSLGKDRAFLHAHAWDIVDDQTHHSYREMLLRRVSREPLQYIVGTQEFYGRPFSVTPSVLIPRPETEILIDSAREKNTWTHPRIVDVGTGSGCVGVTLALELSNAIVYATDIAAAALEVARANAVRLGARVSFARMDLLSALSGPFELIVSNPPYVLAEEKDGLQPEVRDHEPAVALFGKGAPIDLYGRLIRQAARRLVVGGYLMLEIGFSMDVAVREAFGREWILGPSLEDLNGIPRAVCARKTG